MTTGADAGAASGLSIDDLGVPHPVDLASLGMDEPETEPPAPYVYGAADPDSGARRLDEAYGAADSRHWSDVVDHLRGEGPSPEAFARETALDRVLQGIVLYQLRLSIAGERPGCRLGPQFDTGMASYPTRISDVPDDEVRLWREMAPLVAHPRAQARLHDLLSERGEEARGHAVAAGEAYLTTDDGLDPDDGGTTLRTVEYLVRAWELARRYQDWALHARAHTEMVTTAAAELALPAHRPGVVLPLLAAVCAPAMRKQPASAAPQPPGLPTLDDLIESAITRYPEDYTLAQTIDLARSRTKDPAELAALNERHARLLLQQALTVDGFMRQHRLQVAIELARKRGISDVVEEATRELQRIPREDLKLQTITSSVRMPRDAVQRYLDDFTRSPQWADGLTVFLASDCPTGSYQRIVQQERDLARVSVFRRLMRRTQLTREGLPAWSTSDDDQDALAERAWIAGVTAQEYGRLLAHGMHDLAERYDLPDEETLTAHLSLNGRTHMGLSRSLARGLLLYWRGEYEACAHLTVPKIETAARMLLLELDEAVFRTQVGNDPGGYGGLHGLLTVLEEQGMDEDWVFFVKWLLLGPAGVNLRNDLSHGLVLDPGPVMAVLALRAASLFIGLTAPAPEVPRPGVDPVDLRPLAARDRDRDDVLGLLRRSLSEPKPWPVRDGLIGRAAWLAAVATRTTATVLNDVARRLHP